MSKEKKPIVYTDMDKAIVSAFVGVESMTLADMKDATGKDIKPGHLTSAKNKGLIETVGEAFVEKDRVKEVASYTFVTADVLNKEDGKPANYTDSEKEVLAVASKLEGAFTLADLADAMGVEKLSSGRINGLVGKGNIAKGEPVEVPTKVKSKVKVYALIDGAEDKVNA